MVIQQCSQDLLKWDGSFKSGSQEMILSPSWSMHDYDKQGFKPPEEAQNIETREGL